MEQASSRALEITINFHPDRLSATQRPILDVIANDGILRSQFETGTSNGGLTAYVGGDRWTWESLAFQGKYDHCPAADRPKYGALNYQQQGGGASPRFGSSYFKLKRHVINRTTFCYPESWLGPRDFGYSAFVDHLIALAETDDLDSLDSYIEAHVHGTLSILTDVEQLVLDPSYKGTAVESAAGKIGCDIAWHRGFIADVAVFQDFPDYRGAEYVSLAKQIAEDSVITPRIIGTAVKNQPDKAQDLKKVWHYLAKFGNLN